MKIVLETIPQAQQRYETLGDWWFDSDGTLQIRVTSDDPIIPSEYDQFCIALHELVEVMLCKQRGITQQQVDDFDNQWIAQHPDYLNSELNDKEPGDDPTAPYRQEHGFASIIEALMAKELGLKGYPVTCVA
jgi:hypothetical protein